MNEYIMIFFSPYSNTNMYELLPVKGEFLYF